jgi:DNA ligase 1
VVATSAAVASTSARSAKVSNLAELLRRVSPGEVPVVVGFLVGAPRQGKVGVGWAVLGPTAELTPAEESTLTVADVDAAIDALERTTGSGSTAARRQTVDDLFGRATAGEADFLRRLLIGDLRQGAVEGVRASPSSSVRSWWWRSPSTAPSARPATRAASPSASPE